MNNLAKLIKLTMAITAFVFANPAAAFLLQDDNNSYWAADGLTTRSFTGNVVTYNNVIAVNKSATTIPSLSFAVPFAWVINGLLGDSYLPMKWRNDLGGWYTDTYHDQVFPNSGPTSSLTVRMTSNFPVDMTVPMGEIADATGIQQLPLTQPCAGLPSCVAVSAISTPETRSVDDLIPRILLGALGPFEQKRFDISFAFTYGNSYYNSALPVEPIAFTVSEVPLPAAAWLLGPALLGLGFFGRRRKTF